MRTVLLISHAFPPSSATGAHRPLKLAKFLARSAWRPIVLTALTRRHPRPDDSLMALVPSDVRVVRAFSIEPPARRRVVGQGSGPADAAAPAWRSRGQRGLRAVNRSVRAGLLPDELVGWIPFAVSAALGLLAREPVSVIFSTAPELSNHVVAGIVSRRTGVPWIADFRDPCAFNPFDPRRPAWRTRILRAIERRVIRGSSLTLVTTEPMAEFFRAQYPGVAGDQVRVLSNGFDPEDFAGLIPRSADGFTITHAGSLYGSRSISPFLAGLRAMRERAPRLAREVRCRLLGPTGEREWAEIERFGLGGMVEVGGHLPYREALAHLLASDLLLVVTGDAPGLEMYVPRKTYEYMGTGRPILALTGTGAVSRLVTSTGTGVVVSPTDPSEIARALEAFAHAKALGLELIKRSEEEVSRYRWDRIARQFGEHLAEAVG